MEEIEYRNGEKVLYKTSVKLSLPHKKPEEVDCIVTENHVVIETEEPIEVAFPHVISCYVDTPIPISDYTSTSPSSSTEAQNIISNTYATLTIMDNQYNKHELPFQGAARELLGFKQVLDRQVVGRFVGIPKEYHRDETSGKFYSRIKETLRDHTRDDICTSLPKLGVDAQLAPRFRPEEEVWGRGGSLGIIHIPEGPIRWIDVRKEINLSDQGSRTYYQTNFAVPDPRLAPDSPWIRIKATRVKNFPLFGRVVDLRWKGNDSGLGIVSRLNGDYQLKQPIMYSRDILIISIREYSCWILSTTHRRGLTSIGTRYVAFEELWNCYQAIARHLLAEWTTTG